MDIFNGATGSWSTAALTKPRFWLAATSLPNQGLAFFAGGKSEDQGTCDAIMCAHNHQDAIAWCLFHAYI